jgi:DNA gyrase/topoisomerase IV subunit A
MRKNQNHQNQNTISISEFVDDGLRAYSVRSLVRGIPFIGDGFKDVHRKALWGILKRGENADKDTVERIAAYAASATDYHHGVGSMEGTLVTLAQSFAGTNNLPLLTAFGQFGTRLDPKHLHRATFGQSSHRTSECCSQRMMTSFLNNLCQVT